MIGGMLGGYRIIERIGMGGMASVYKAYDASTDRYVAVKVLPAHYSQDPKFIERFRREAKAIARLEHMNILPVHGYGEDEQSGTTTAYLVMRYMEAGTLTERLQAGPLTLAEIGRLLSQIAAALDYAHANGVLHRDVKPSNVLLDREGNAFLTDFGIAKIVEGMPDLTGTGMALGTPQYMSPEQCRGLRDLTPASDIYSLGVMLYQMLTGQVPYQAETPLAVLQMHLNDPLPPPRSVRPDLPEAIERVVLKALAKDPDQRFETCAAMAEAYRKGEAAAAMEAPTPPGEVTPPEFETIDVSESEPEPPEQRRRPVWLWPAAVVVAACIVGFAICVLSGALNPDNRGAGGQQADETPAPFEPTPAGGELPPPQEVVPPGSPDECRADPLGCAEVPPGETLKVVALLPLTGPIPEGFGDSLSNATSMAVDERPEVFGHGVELILFDTQCDPDAAARVAAEAPPDPAVVGVIGTGCSGAARAVLPVLSEAGLVMISPSNTAASLTDPDGDWLPGYYRTVDGDALQGELSAAFAREVLDAHTAAILFDDGPYGHSLNEAFSRAFQASGGEVVFEHPVVPGDDSFVDPLTAIAEQEIDVIYLPVFNPEVGIIVAQARELGLDVRLISGEEAMSPDLVAQARRGAEGVFLTGLHLSGPAIDDFRARYEGQFGQPPQDYAPFAYDAYNLLLDAVEQVGFVDDTGALYVGRQALRDALTNTRGFPGLTGPLSCTPTGDCGSGHNKAVFEVRPEDVSGDFSPEPVWP